MGRDSSQHYSIAPADFGCTLHSCIASRCALGSHGPGDDPRYQMPFDTSGQYLDQHGRIGRVFGSDGPSQYVSGGWNASGRSRRTVDIQYSGTCLSHHAQRGDDGAETPSQNFSHIPDGHRYSLEHWNGHSSNGD